MQTQDKAELLNNLSVAYQRLESTNKDIIKLKQSEEILEKISQIVKSLNV